MGLKLKILLVLILLCEGTATNAQHVYESIDSLLTYAEKNSSTLRNDYYQLSLAQRAKITAAYSVLDLNGNLSLNTTHNTKLPISVFPADAFGGTPGTYREVTTGVPYTNAFNQTLDIKLINPVGWSNLKLANINIDISQANSLISKKAVYENIGICFYNIQSLQIQKTTTEQNQKIVDSIVNMIQNKVEGGISRQQDLNNAKITSLKMKENLTQIILSIKQQYSILKSLCDIPEIDSVIITNPSTTYFDKAIPEIVPNYTKSQLYTLKSKYAFAAFTQAKNMLLPSISAFGSNMYQQFSQSFSLFDNTQNWINSNYIGLKATWQIPSASTFSQIATQRINYKMALENANHVKLEDESNYSILLLEYLKAKSLYSNKQQILELLVDSYNKNFENYQHGIIDNTELLNSLNDRISAYYDSQSALISLQVQMFKIRLNNKIR